MSITILGDYGYEKSLFLAIVLILYFQDICSVIKCKCDIDFYINY